jgi:hypothetical protein
MTLNDVPHTGLIREADLATDGNVLNVQLIASPASTAKSLTVVSDENWQDVFGPRSASIVSVTAEASGVALAFDLGGENSSEVSLHVYRDGLRVASGLPGTTTSWLDESVDPDAAESL